MDSILKIDSQANVWVKRNNGATEIIEVVPEINSDQIAYGLYIAFEKRTDKVGRILFDVDGYWIYDGTVLTVDEQEQVARFIINYTERF